MGNELGINIKTRLKSMKRTQGDLANYCNVSNVAVTKWIKGGEITTDNLVKVADFLNTSIDRLLDRNFVIAENELERQLLMFYRGMRFEHKDDLILFANNLYSLDNPNDKKANPVGDKKNVKQ